MAEQEQGKWQFEEEIKALGAEEVQAEFAGYFTSIVCSILLSSWVNHQSPGERAGQRQREVQRGGAPAGGVARVGEGDSEREEKGSRIQRGL